MQSTTTDSIKLVVVFLLSFFAAPLFAQTATYNEAYTIQGFSQPGRISQVASSITGIVQSREVKEGELVQKGDCLIRLDRRVHDEKLKLARVAKDSIGDLQSVEAELSSKIARLSRLNELSNRNHATAIELMQAQDDVAIASANVQRVRDRMAQTAADYSRLLIESEQYIIRAPFDGVVVKFAKEAGEYVGPGEAGVCTIAELETLCVEFLLPRNFRNSFGIGDQVEVVFTIANQTVAGTVHYISPFPSGETNTYVAKVRVENAVGQLSAGERCQLKTRLDLNKTEDTPGKSSLTVRGQ